MTHAFILESKDENDRDYYLLNDFVRHGFSGVGGPDSVVVGLQDGAVFNSVKARKDQRDDLREAVIVVILDGLSGSVNQDT